MKTVSVVMPLYNAERYLSETIQSVLSQTYEDFELICIDDCSTDDTRKILEDFQNRDNRIRVLVNKDRKGAAKSRNRGIKEAQGKYLTFLDGDDIYDEEVIDKAYHAMERYDVDIVMFEYMHVPSDEIYNKRKMERSASFLEKYGKSTFSVKKFPPEEFPNWSDSVCDKMFRREFINNNYIEFQDLPCFNDVYFSKMASYCAEKIIWLDDNRVMVYARDHFEASRISNDRDPMCAYYAMEKLAEELNKRNMMNDLAKYFYYRCLTMMFSVMNTEKDEKRRRSFYNFLHNKGINKYIDYGGENYEKIGIYNQYLLEGFRNNTYESGWFISLDTYFQVFLRKNGEKICRYIVDKLRKKNTVIIWGIGINGTSLLRYLNKHNIRILAAVDADEKKQGDIVEEYEILNPSRFLNKVDYIIVTSDYVYQDVEARLKGKKGVVVNAFELLVQKECKI